MQKDIIKNNELFKIKDGLHDTNIDAVKIFKTEKPILGAPQVFDVCLVLVLQGKKVANLTSISFIGDSNNYLAIPATLPLVCETYGTKKEPFIALLISLDRKMMYEIIEKLESRELCENTGSSYGIFADKVTNKIEDSITNLLDILESKEESKILGEKVLTELFYRILIGQNSKILHKMFLNNNNESNIAKALKIIHDNYKDTYDIEALARQCDMSVSSFHYHFKKITSFTPLQYIKRIKLTKAKDYLLKYDYKVSDVANKLGYDTPSHFGRDFKNYFGYPPKESKLNR